MSSTSTPQSEFKAKTFFTRALMFSKFLQSAVTKPKTWLEYGLKFLTTQLMFIAVVICALIGFGSIYIHFKNAQIPITFFEEFKVEIVGRVQCCTKEKCHNVSYIGIELYDDNIFYQDSILFDTLSDENGDFNISVNSKQFGKMRPYLQVRHRCNTGVDASIAYQPYRISWYRIPPEYVIESHDKHSKVYYLYPLSLNGEGFLETRWELCPFQVCDERIVKKMFNQSTINKYKQIVTKHMYYTL